MRPLYPGLLIFALVGCAGESRFDDTQPPTGLPALTADLRKVLAHREPVQSCGPDRSFTSDRALLVLSARDCLSCRSVGYLVRQLASRTEFDVLTAHQDAPVVCEFLRKEKAGAAVFGFKGGRFRNVALADRFLLFRRVSGGGIAGAVLESDPGRVLAQWDSLVHVDPVP
jgi:hypothetical protein